MQCVNVCEAISGYFMFYELSKNPDSNKPDLYVIMNFPGESSEIIFLGLWGLYLRH